MAMAELLPGCVVAHPIVAGMHEVMNDKALNLETLRELCDLKVINWVSTYVITESLRMVVQCIPLGKSSKQKLHKHHTGWFQAFRGSDGPQNLLYSILKLRSDVLDKSSIDLGALTFRATPCFLVDDGLVQVVVISDQWLSERTLWSPEYVRNKCGVAGGITKISQFWDWERKTQFQHNSRHQIIQVHDLSFICFLPQNNPDLWRSKDLEMFKRVFDKIVRTKFIKAIQEKNFDEVRKNRKCLFTEGVGDETATMVDCFNKMMRLPSFETFFLSVFESWPTLHKQHALVFSEARYLEFVFKARPVGDAKKTVAAIAQANQGSLVKVWRETCDRCNKSDADAYQKSSEALTKNAAELEAYVQHVVAWFQMRGLSSLLDLVPKPMDVAALGGDVAARFGKWFYFQYTGDQSAPYDKRGRRSYRHVVVRRPERCSSWSFVGF